MSTSGHSFTLRLSGNIAERLDELYDAGCDDATFGSVDGVGHADFDREAEGMEAAIASAIEDIGKVGGVRVEAVDDFPPGAANTSGR